tara:strand:+ start:881 stop:1891 length:1011 start_codon:yes stop_codon:yes gene_type:complete
MAVKIAINGFGRMGRLGLRAGWGLEELHFSHVNDPAGNAIQAAHLLEFDTVHGTWKREISGRDGSIRVQGHDITYSMEENISGLDWEALGIDIVLECSGKYKTLDDLQGHIDNGAKKVIVSAPVKSPKALNIVMGVNDHLYNPSIHEIITAASCTTNCLAPIVKVIIENYELRHGIITTIHDVTNTQVIVDGFHEDLRRARSGINSLIPTTTGSASAITQIYPKLEGKLSGVAIRVPLLNASLIDCVFELERATTSGELNGYFESASQGHLKNILGYEDRPLVSSDFLNDPRSSIVDGPSTMIVDGTQAKVLAWYDNEWGYMNRLIELAQKVAIEF